MKISIDLQDTGDGIDMTISSEAKDVPRAIADEATRIIESVIAESKKHHAGRVSKSSGFMCVVER